MFSDADFIDLTQEAQEANDDDDQSAIHPQRIEPTGGGKYVKPQDISPIPVLQKTSSNRGRKKSTASVITSSPYKAALEESRQKKTKTESPSNSGITTCPSTSNATVSKGKATISKKKEAKRSVKGKGKRKLNFKDVDSEEESDVSISSGESDLSIPALGQTPDGEDVDCLLCCESFSNSKPGEMWIQCMVCRRWAHIKCTANEKDAFVCEFCG